MVNNFLIHAEIRWHYKTKFIFCHPRKQISGSPFPKKMFRNISIELQTNIRYQTYMFQNNCEIDVWTPSFLSNLTEVSPRNRLCQFGHEPLELYDGFQIIAMDISVFTQVLLNICFLYLHSSETLLVVL